MPARSIPLPLRASIVCAALALALAVAAPPAGAAFPGRDGRLVYGWLGQGIAWSPGPRLVYEDQAIRTIPPRGGTPRTLRSCVRTSDGPDAGDCGIAYRDPAVSPDGRRVAFDAGPSLALMRIDGKGFHLLPRHGADDGSPAFSPDGKRIAFTVSAATETEPPSHDVWVADLTGGRDRRVAVGGEAPAWSVRGWIAFARPDGIYRVRPDGRGLRRLVARGGCTDVDWSPHGTKLALACGTLVLIANGDGSSLRLVRRGLRGEVRWSPSGRSLAISDPNEGLFTVRTDGARLRAPVSTPVSAYGPSQVLGADWQPLPR